MGNTANASWQILNKNLDFLAEHLQLGIDVTSKFAQQRILSEFESLLVTTSTSVPTGVSHLDDSPVIIANHNLDDGRLVAQLKSG
jgi:hypothetical protein